MKLITFPGQGSPIGLDAFESYLTRNFNGFNRVFQASKYADIVKSIGARKTSADSIVGCSGLLFEAYQLENGTQEQLCFLGHSLGELSCLAAGNHLYDIPTTMNIARKRHELMVATTRQYKVTRGLEDMQFAMWAITAPKSTDLRRDLERIISKMQSLGAKSLQLANVNAKTQCVVTGFEQDLEALKQVLAQGNAIRFKSIPLANPDGIPFHNSEVLSPIIEPLKDFMWKKLKRTGSHTKRKLDHPIISNVSGCCETDVDTAISNFVSGSTKTVEFISCCETIDALEISTSANIGPGNVVGVLVKRNCGIGANFDWS
ncbi:LAMI_0H06150g1_1 [Lachancea mirantina]|uniref:[acyl-carrier-protein] S-malonyltransferase n=1 Tax=Lachancea mirantina TaxID=1230905 RepID=A0A1G4KF59_9SACH|nr:LAMI_0H06150g1_1 [Lachancea mirantina]